jgi:thioredoxin-related protein
VLTSGPIVAQEVQWRNDYNKARQESKDKNRPLVIDFGTSGCCWCQKLDAVTFRDPAIVQLLNDNFIPLKIDATREMKLTAALKIDSFPTLVFATSDGKILGVHEGFVDARQFTQQLRRAMTESTPKIQSQPQTTVAIGDQAVAEPIDRGPNRVQTTSATTAAPSDVPERSRTASMMLALAKDEYNAQRYVNCLERCDLLAARYPDLPEGEEARRLANTIKGDPERARKICADLTDRLGELSLTLAENCIRQGQSQQAIIYLERVLAACPGTRHAQVAQASLARLQSELAAKPGTTPIVRAQAP